jgi:hypothetical protein
MIDVALTLVYLKVIKDGMGMNAWQEPQLIEIQRQLAQVHLISSVAYSLRAERAGVCRIICDEQTARYTMLARSPRKPGLWGKLRDPHWWLFNYGSPGLLYENAATLAEASQKTLDAVDTRNEIIHPHLVDKAARAIQQTFSRFSLKSYLAGSMLPNCANALKTTAQTQALVNEASVVCALERYRIKNKKYPQQLKDFIPLFANDLPKDSVNGQPLRYKLRDDGTYLLYSVAWNEVDDGGTAPPNKNWDVAAVRPVDWVWSDDGLP